MTIHPLLQILAGIFFFTNTVLFVVLIVVALKLLGIVQGLMPRIVTIEKQVIDLVGKVQALTANLQETVGNVGGKARGVVGSVEGMTQSASRQFERFSPFVIGALTAIRLVKALNDTKKGRSLAKSTSRKGIAKKPAKGGVAGILNRFRA